MRTVGPMAGSAAGSRTGGEVSVREALVALQEVDSALDQLRHRIERLDERAAAAAVAEELRAAHAERVAADGDRQRAEAEMTRIENDSADLDRHRLRLEAQMKTIISPREAEALQHEIATLLEQRGALDDRGLEMLEAMSDAEARGERATLAEPEIQRRLAEAEAQLAEAEAVLIRQTHDLEPVRAAAAGALDASTLQRYETMRRQHAGVAVARLQANKCSGCHLDLSVGEADNVRRVPDDQIPECPSCGRLLVP